MAVGSSRDKTNVKFFFPFRFESQLLILNTTGHMYVLWLYVTYATTQRLNANYKYFI